MKIAANLSKCIRIPLVSVLYFLIFFSYLTPMYIRWLPGIAVLDQGLMYLSMLIMLIIIIKKYRTIRWPIVLIGVSYIILIFASYMNGGQVSEAIKHVIKVTLLCLTLGAFMEEPLKTERLLRFIANYSCIFFLLNTVLVLLYRNGIPGLSNTKGIPFFLYGNVNSTIKYILPGTLCSYILDAKKDKLSARSIIFNLGIIIIFVFSYHATTTLIGMLFFFLWFQMRFALLKRAKILYLYVVITITIIEVIMIILTNSNVITTVANFFGKDATLSGRTHLWKFCIRSIHRGSFWGFGDQSEDRLFQMIGNVNGSHNYFLDIIYQRGSIGIICFIVMVIIPIISNKKISMEMYILIGCCCTYLVMFGFEPFYMTEYFFIPIFYIACLLSLHDKKVRTSTQFRKLKMKYSTETIYIKWRKQV